MITKEIKTLYTERLTLRPFKKGDGVFMFKNWASDPLVTKYLRYAPHKSVEESEKVVEMFIESTENKTNYIFALCLTGSDEPFGSIGLEVMSKVDDICEFGYNISRSMWNKGYVTEATKAVIAFAFDELQANRVEACHSVLNPASGRVMEKCGMTKEGVLRDGYKTNEGIYQTSNLYSILRREYEKTK